MLLLLRRLALSIVLLQLAACGGGSESGLVDPDVKEPSQQSFRLSGVIQIANSIAIDSDSNDQNAKMVENNTQAQAQQISSVVQLSGFVAKSPTTIANQRFGAKTDPTDVFEATLLKGQVITLTISGWNAQNTSSPDLDLTLINKENQQSQFSFGREKTESITVTANGSYYIVVEAEAGYSGYLLTIDRSRSALVHQASVKQTPPSQFVLGQAIVQYREVSAVNNPFVDANDVANSEQRRSPSRADAIISRKTAFADLGLTSNHHGTERAALVEFAPQDISPSAMTALSSSSTYSAKSGDQNEESAYRRELAQHYPELYKKLKTYDVIKSLNRRDDVVYAEPNYIRQAKLIPNDRGYKSQWHYPLINLPKAWDITTGTPAQGQVIVAVIDTGILPNHPDLKNQLVPGYDFLNNVQQANDGDGIDSDPTDPGDGSPDNGQRNSWHGSHVAGTIAAQSNNNIGVAGVSWGAKIMPLRALGVGGGTTYSIVQSIRFAAGLSNDSGTVPAQRADIINMSLGGPNFSETEQNAIRDAHNAGVILVAAAGNERTSAPSYPAAFPNVISVSAISADRRFVSAYSNLGSTIDVAAPGGDMSRDVDGDGYPDGVLSTLKNNVTGNLTYDFQQGTSMAAPHVSGVFALMKAVNPSLTPAQVNAALVAGRLTVDAGQPGRDDLYGYGIIDAYKAVNFAKTEALPDVVILPSSNALQFASSQTSQVVDLANIGRLGNTNQIQVTAVESSAPWLTVSTTAKNATAFASYQFTVNRAGLALGVYDTTVTFRFAHQGTALTAQTAIKVRMYVGLTAKASDAGPLYVLAREQGVTLKEGENHPETRVTAVDGQYTFRFDGLKAGRYIIHAGTDSDSNFIICNEHEACGLYPTINQPVAVNLNRNITGVNFSVGIDRPVDLNTNQYNKNQSKVDDTAPRQGGQTAQQPAVVPRAVSQQGATQ